MKQIRIGTLVSGMDAVRLLPQIIPHGFESFSLTFWQSTHQMDLSELAKEVKEIIADQDIVISSLSIFGNALTGEGDNSDTLASWERLIDHAHEFGTDLVTGFTGRMPGAIDQSMHQFTKVFGELTKRAENAGVKLAFENCDMGGTWAEGDWNIAHNPTAWEMMFHAVPAENMGLQWEPCHQMVSLIDPIPQLRRWLEKGKIFNVHGKDATIAWDIVREFGIHGPKPFVWHRTPGFGDSNWTDIISILRQGRYEGSIDIEGFHDPVYREDWEMTGQVHGLNYLKQCRGGDFITNPK
ncbi:sugar phosphate isomerase/epimerase [Pullulanibacillus pueri]|uniref:Sugar phosphate isomerase n=1 Tax=Pullulanibacillus pueri TaxID=1437324 RepID=A0A8J3EJX8_9BACL|nr:sugar phosphate isomerase/epimerase [Pullulanibacillus pueri]MBM7679912.1 sugar phosphate isomerase/epimerase [Pullulanibacillus pueri]GGH73455.1 sugar phosphate isomerase [Pullulanibacillus pueri]